MRFVTLVFLLLLLLLPCLADTKPTEETIEVLRQGRVFYDLSESGAPIIVFQPGTPREIEDAVQYVLKSGLLEPRVYYYSKPTGAFEHSPLVESLYKMADFEVTDEHIDLLRQLVVYSVEIDEETGETLVLFDSKRPYGDFTYYQAEMARHLGLPTSLNPRGEVVIDRELEKRLTALHGEMQIVLAIFLGEFVL